MYGEVLESRPIGLEVELTIIPRYCEGHMVQEVESKGVTMVDPGGGNAIEQKVSQYRLDGDNRVCSHMFDLDRVAGGLYERVVGMDFIPTLNGLVV
jgi:hypothetical protein